MRPHAVLIGYSVRGRVVLSTLFAQGHATDFTVIDSDPDRVAQASVDGIRAVTGEGWRLGVLWSAGVHTSEHVVVAVTDDAQALRITSVVRSLNEAATITTLIRSTELHELIEFFGADHVVTEDRAGEWSLEVASAPFDDLPHLEWVVLERPVVEDEIGLLPLECGNDVLAVLRDGQRIWAEDPVVGKLRGDDRLVVLTDAPAPTDGL
ncbi:NAD(P)-binding protein [Lentzea sp. CC55]|uniref:NAD(P)-binding protein n=1 Tax=Lentzea sp. CC55 TaxID=2884909 RepID=UPI001F2A3ABC|nr:NAD(P)-binding protein [Lentzea sp. CC55]MCG8922541.1 NAD-binding protein [Lentzea sp. CC55]